MEATKKFYQEVDTTSREAMIEFLRSHFRYDTMSSWNRSTAYANNVKVHRVIPSSLQDAVHEMLNMHDVTSSVNFLLEEWQASTGDTYTAAFNGRSSGYIVMYECEARKEYIIRPDAYKEDHPSGAYSDYLGRWVKKPEAEERGWIGKTYKSVNTFPGRSIDEDWDYEEESDEWLQQRVALVQSFDKLCDDVVSNCIYYAEHYELDEEEILIPKTVKVIRPKP